MQMTAEGGKIGLDGDAVDERGAVPMALPTSRGRGVFGLCDSSMAAASCVPDGLSVRHNNSSRADPLLGTFFGGGVRTLGLFQVIVRLTFGNI